jgi:hypothetical protein
MCGILLTDQSAYQQMTSHRNIEDEVHQHRDKGIEK